MEVLVAMLVLGVGLLGLAGLQITGLKANESARIRTEVTFAAYDLGDRLRAAPTEFFSKASGPKGLRSISAQDCAAFGAEECATITAGTDTLTRWHKDFCCLGLPAPTSGDLASVNCQDGNACGDDNCAITIRWDDGRGEGKATSDKEFRFCSRFPTAM